jgi:opacity protein-like surface antigen
MKTTYNLVRVIALATALGTATSSQAEERVVNFAVSDVKPRADVGLGSYVGAFGGITVLQDSDATLNASKVVPGLPGDFNLKDNNRIGPVGGIKAGFQFPMNPIGDSAFSYGFGAETEVFYAGYNYEGVAATSAALSGLPGTADTTYKTDLDLYIFSVNGLAKLQIWQFRPYVGAGVGAAYVQSRNATLKNPTALPGVPANGNVLAEDSQNDLQIALQGIAGGEFFVTHNFSIFAEYKMLVLPDLAFDYDDAAGKNSKVNIEFTPMALHLLTAGAKFYF